MCRGEARLPGQHCLSSLSFQDIEDTEQEGEEWSKKPNRLLWAVIADCLPRAESGQKKHL